MISKDEINELYDKLQSRKLHPRGDFDKQGRFYLQERQLVNVRTPSKAYPYSEMMAGRTKKYIKALIDEYSLTSIREVERFFIAKGVNYAKYN